MLQNYILQSSRQCNKRCPGNILQKFPTGNYNLLKLRSKWLCLRAQHKRSTREDVCVVKDVYASMELTQFSRYNLPSVSLLLRNAKRFVYAIIFPLV